MDNKVLVSKAIYIMKAIAIVTVAMAHCTYIDSDFQRVTDIFGTIGVPIFLISGGLFYNNKRDWKDFIGRKFKRIVVPWILWGIGTYMLHTVSDHNRLTIIELLKWILGYKTWLYYVPVVLACYIVFRVSTNVKYACVIAIMSLVSYIATSVGFLELHILTNCQNPFNWMGFFAIGVLLQNWGFKEKIPFKEKKLLMLIASSVTLAMLGTIYYMYTLNKQITPSYWNAFSVVFELNACITIYYLAVVLADKFNAKLIVDIGKNSYPIFFSHMQIGIRAINILCMSFWNKMSGVEFAWITVIRGGSSFI